MLFSGDDALKRTEALSGGEAARLIFCRLMLEKPNFLILDEPTNHLDLESINALNIALQKYRRDAAAGHARSRRDRRSRDADLARTPGQARRLPRTVRRVSAGCDTAACLNSRNRRRKGKPPAPPLDCSNLVGQAFNRFPTTSVSPSIACVDYRGRGPSAQRDAPP